MIEVDITGGLLDKFPIYAQVGVPEVWRYDGQRLRIYLLTAERYVESETSLALPLLTGPRLSETLAQSKTLKRTALLRSFRTWIRQERRRRDESAGLKVLPLLHLTPECIASGFTIPGIAGSLRRFELVFHRALCAGLRECLHDPDIAWDHKVRHVGFAVLDQFTGSNFAPGWSTIATMTSSSPNSEGIA